MKIGNWKVSKKENWTEVGDYYFEEKKKSCPNTIVDSFSYRKNIRTVEAFEIIE